MKFTFIEPEIGKISKDPQPASWIRKEFQILKPIEEGKVYMTALGVYKPFLNGKKLTENLLLPGFTNYKRRVQYQEYDITGMLLQGKNVIGSVIGDGWYRGNVGAFNKRNVFGNKLKFACCICLKYQDGTTEEVYTDSSWEATQEGPVRQNDLKILEIYDARMELTGWTDPAVSFSNEKKKKWHLCQLSAYNGKIVPDQGEPVLEQERFSPEVLHTPDGSIVLDFKQNLAGYVRFSVNGTAGTQIAMVMGETLDENGNFTLKNLQGEGRGAEIMPVGQRLEYILKNGFQTFQPFSLISGYRYVKLENWPEEVRVENFQSIAVYSNLKRTGGFTCSNEYINKFVENVCWSQKSNFVDIPTDCPQRERAGWAGDVNVFMETANYLTDTRKFIDKWMQDFIAAQCKNGALPYIIPEIPAIGAGKSSAGWSDAIGTVPLVQYLFYGEKDLIESTYDTVKKLVEYNRKRAMKRHLLHIYKIQPWYNYVLDTGFHYGEWLEPGGSNGKDALKAIAYPDAEVATAWFYYTTRNLAVMAHILGKDEDIEKYELLARKIKDAYRRAFLPGGQVYSHRQCKYIRPIYMGLAEKEEIPQIVRRLNQLCIANHYHIGTGFLTTYKVLQVLTDYGYTETAYKMLENEECPGWLYEIKKGATTVWEGWNAITPDNRIKPLSMNHYAPGACVSWFFSHCAGIKPLTPGFAKVQIKPSPGGSLTFAKAEYNSVRGKIVSSWTIADGTFTITLEIPETVEAKLILPDGSVYENVRSGSYSCQISSQAEME